MVLHAAAAAAASTTLIVALSLGEWKMTANVPVLIETCELKPNRGRCDCTVRKHGGGQKMRRIVSQPKVFQFATK